MILFGRFFYKPTKGDIILIILMLLFLPSLWCVNGLTHKYVDEADLETLTVHYLKHEERSKNRLQLSFTDHGPLDVLLDSVSAVKEKMIAMVIGTELTIQVDPGSQRIMNIRSPKETILTYEESNQYIRKERNHSFLIAGMFLATEIIFAYPYLKRKMKEKNEQRYKPKDGFIIKRN